MLHFNRFPWLWQQKFYARLRVQGEMLIFVYRIEKFLLHLTFVSAII